MKPTNLPKFEVTAYRLRDPQVVQLDAIDTSSASNPLRPLPIKINDILIRTIATKMTI